MKSPRKVPGSRWLTLAILAYAVAAGLILLVAYQRNLLSDGPFWNGVIGNAMAALLELLVVGLLIAWALSKRTEERWTYARSLAHARLLDQISAAWDAVVGRHDSTRDRLRMIYDFDGITSNPGPDYASLLHSDAILHRERVGENRAFSAKLSSDKVASELSDISATLGRVSHEIENTLALIGAQCDPEIWTTALCAVEEIKRFQLTISSRQHNPDSLIIQTSVMMDRLAKTGVQIARTAKCAESLDAHMEKIVREANSIAEFRGDVERLGHHIRSGS